MELLSFMFPNVLKCNLQEPVMDLVESGYSFKQGGIYVRFLPEIISFILKKRHF